MECACTYDKDRGEIVDLCGAHNHVVRLARQIERGACAGIADAWAKEMQGTAMARSAAEGIAMEIRARR